MLWDKLYGRQPAVAAFIAELDPALIRVRGTAVYMTGNPDVVPTALLHNIKHNQVLHEQVVLMTVRTQRHPVRRRGASGSRSRRSARASSGSSCSYGFMDQPDVPRALELCRARGLPARPDADLVLPRPRDADPDAPARRWGRSRRGVFTALAAGSLSATAYFKIPPERVVELGTQLEV